MDADRESLRHKDSNSLSIFLKEKKIHLCRRTFSFMVLSVDEIKHRLPVKYVHLFEDEYFVRWLDKKIEKNPDMTISTFEKYVPFVHEFFVEYVGSSPSEVVKYVKSSDEAIEQANEKLGHWFNLMTKRSVAKTKKELSVQPVSWNVARKKVSTIAEFFARLKVKLDYDVPVGRAPDERTFAPSSAFIKSALDLVKDKELRSYILISKECGMSPIDLFNTDIDEKFYDEVQQKTYPSVREQYAQGVVPILIQGKSRIKSGVRYIGLLGEEAINSLEFYDNRMVNSKSLSSKSWLRRIERQFKGIASALGQPRFTPKSLRAFLASRLRAANLNEQLAKVITGHAIADIERFYLDFDENELRDAYRLIYPRLRVLSEIKLDITVSSS